MCSFQFFRPPVCGSSIVGDKINGIVAFVFEDLLSLIQLSVVRKLDGGMSFY